MTKDEIIQKMTEIMRETFNMPDLNVVPELTSKDVKKWDSLSNIRLIVSVEEAFDIRFSTSEVVGLENVGAFIDLVSLKMNG